MVSKLGAEMASKGDMLLGRILSDGDDRLANDLLSEFLAGYPIDNLRLLLRSDHIEAAKAGAWIASELGEAIEPLVDDLVDLLSHSSKYVRFYSVDSMRLGAGKNRGDAIAETMLLLEDPEKAVRWKAMNFLARLDREQLVASLPYLEGTDIGTLLGQLLWENQQVVLEQVASGNELLQRFAAATAGRLALAGDSTLLSKLVDVGAPEVHEFARDLLDLLEVARS